MAAITSGAELVKRLRESGTGADKLAVARAVLEGRGAQATAADVVAALEARYPGSVTVEKARRFAETGEYNPLLKKPEPVHVEDRLAPPQVGVDKPGVGASVVEQSRPTAGAKK